MGEGEEIRSFVVGVVGLSALSLRAAKVDFEDAVVIVEWSVLACYSGTSGTLNRASAFLGGARPN